MRTTAGVTLILALLATACGGGALPAAVTQVPTAVVAPTATPLPASPIRFGFFGPLTGPTAQAGQALLQGAQLRVKEINAKGGVLGRKIDLVSCDDKSSNEEGVKCVTKLIEQDKVFAIVATLHSPIISATAPITDRNKVPMVGAGTGVDWCKQGFKYLWRETANSDANAKALAVAVSKLGTKKIAILNSNDDYGKSGAASLKAIPGLQVVAQETYKRGDRDFSGQIIKLVAAKPDAIGVWGLGDELGPMTNQLRQQGWAGPILGPEGYTLPEVAQIAGDNVNGVIFASLYYIPKQAADYPDPQIRAFLQAFQGEFGSLPASDNAYRSYDGVTILVTAIQRANAFDPDKVRDAINASSDIKGLAGTFNFAKGGCEGIDASNLWIYKDKKVTAF